MLKSGNIQVEDVKYHWSIYRQPRWTSTRSLIGLRILVEPVESSTRELLLEFGIERNRHGDMPQHQRFRVPEKRLIQCVQDAIKAGYDPSSRGKRFVFEAGSVIPS